MVADIREEFDILEDATGVGVAPSKSVAGDSSSGKIGMTTFSYQDSNGNVVLPQTVSNGNAGQQLLPVLTPDTTTASTALGALNAAVSIAMQGLPSAGFQISAGTLVGTLTPEISIDGGTTWLPTNFYDFTTSAVVSSYTFGSANPLKFLTVITLGGTSNVRVRVSAYTSGTANAILRATHGTIITLSPNGAGGGAAAFNTVSTTYPTLIGNTAAQILASNVSRKFALIVNNSGSQMTIQFGTSTGLGASSGYIIPARGSYTIAGDNLYTGSIFGFCSAGINLTVFEGTP